MSYRETRALDGSNWRTPSETDAQETHLTQRVRVVSRPTLALVALGVVACAAAYLYFQVPESVDEEALGQRFSDEFRRRYEEWREQENLGRRQSGRSDLIPPLPPEPPHNPDAIRMSGESDPYNPPDTKKVNPEVRDLMKELRAARSVQHCLAILRAHPEITVDAHIVNELLLKTQSVPEALKLLSQFNTTLDSYVLTTIVSKASTADEGLQTLLSLTTEYPHLRVNNFMLSNIMFRARSASEAYGMMNELLARFPSVPVNASMKAAVYYNTTSLSELKWYRATLDQRFPGTQLDCKGISLLYNKAVEFRSDPGVKDFIKALGVYSDANPSFAQSLNTRPGVLIQKSLALFVTGDEKNAIEVLKQALALGNRLTAPDIRTLSHVTFTFLPENHSLRAVLAATLRHNGMENVIQSALRAAARYADAREAAIADISYSIRSERYGGGSVFDGTHDRPIDRDARRVAPPKKY